MLATRESAQPHINMTTQEVLQWFNVLGVPILMLLQKMDKRLSRLELIEQLKAEGRMSTGSIKL